MVDGLEVLDFKSWKEFKSDFFDRVRAAQVTAWSDAEHDWHTRRFVFRGQACAEWGLISSFDRWLIKQPGFNVIDDRAEPMYWDLLEDFVVNGQDMELLPVEYNEIPRRSDDMKRFASENAKNLALLLKLQAYAQHRGLATRLLDWSHSPYISAFFAFSEWRMCRCDYIGIWCLDITETSRLFQDKDFSLFDSGGSNDRRQLWQRGVFSRNDSNILEAQELFKDSNKRCRAGIRCPALLLCRIPLVEYEQALLDLRMMRISHISVFPDQEGLVKQAEFSLERRHKLAHPRQGL